MTDDDQAEVLSVRRDKGLNGLPSHASARKRDHVRDWAAREPDAGPRQPAMWAVSEAVSEAVYGQYPKGFVRWATRALGVQVSEIVHVCSGSLGRAGRCSIDIRPAAVPDVIADARALPLRDGSVRAVMIDPPYAVEYAKGLYGLEYPRPSHLLAEGARVVAPGGVVALLHFLVMSPPLGCTIERTWGVTTGCGYRIRAFTVYRKRHAELDL